MNRFLSILLALLSPLTAAAANLASGEWFIDSDPGRGAGTAFVLPAEPDASVSVTIPAAVLNVLEPGFHLLGVRVLDGEDEWGHVVWRAFHKDPELEIPRLLAAAEWFIDEDPGAGLGTAFALPEAQAGSALPQIPASVLNQLSDGYHLLGVRTRDNLSHWGPVLWRGFHIDRSPEIPPHIVSVEYRIFRDGSEVSHATAAASPAGSSVSLTVAHGTADLLLDAAHLLQVVPIDALGRRGHAAYADFTVQTIVSPPSVTTAAAYGVTSDFAITGGNVTDSGGAGVTERGVVYATAQNPTTATGTKMPAGAGTGGFASHLTGLTPATTYYVRAYAINSEGTAYGAQISFATRLALPPGAGTMQAIYDFSLPAGSAANAPAAALHGAEAGEGAGDALHVLDLNGDGLDDMLICSAYMDPAGREDAGIIRVWFGRPGFSGVKDAAGLHGDPADVTIHGAKAYDSLGLEQRLILSDDLNGDGVDDLILLTSPDIGARPDSAEAFVIFGRQHPAVFPQVIDLAVQGVGGYDLCLNGQDDWEHFISAATADLNGDGVADLVVSGGRRLAEPVVYVIFGGDALPAAGAIELAQSGVGGASVTLLGAGYVEDLVFGDVNGDGVADLAVGARYADFPGGGREWAGVVYVVFGREAPAAFPAALTLTTQGSAGADVTLYGAAANDQLTVSAIADLTGDGIDDLVLHASNDDGPDDTRTNAGATYLVWGRAAPLTFPATLDMGVQGDGGADVTIYHEDRLGEPFGRGAIETADVNGDGITDLILAAGLYAPGSHAYLVFGREPSLFEATLDLSIQGLEGHNVKIFSSPNISTGMLVGLNRMTTGDLNGDGIADLVFGTHQNQAHIVLGRSLSDAFPVLIDLVAFGPAGSSAVVRGRSGQDWDDVLSLWGMVCGDFNGDGVTDLLLSATGMNGPLGDRPSAGGACLLAGAPGVPVYKPGFELLRQADIDERVPVGSVLDIGSADVVGMYLLNTGSALLTLTGDPVIEISGAHAGDFQIIKSYLDSMEPGETSSFSIHFWPRALGTRTATVSIANNTADTNPFTFTLQGSGLVPLVGVVHQGAEIASHGELDFGLTPAQGGERVLHLEIHNSGNAPLEGLDAAITENDGAEFEIVTAPASAIEPGAMTVLSVRFAPSEGGPRQARLELIAGNAPNAPFWEPFVIQLTGTGAAPLLEVVHQGAALLSYEVLDFGAVAVQGGTRLLHLQLHNRGNAPMTDITAGLLDNVGGEFEIVSLSTPIVQVGAMALLSVRFSPTGEGPRARAWLEISSSASNAASGDQFVVHLGGTGLPATTVPKPIMEEPGSLVHRVGEEVVLPLYASFSPTKFVVKGLPPGLRYDAASQSILGRPKAAKLDRSGNPLAYQVRLRASNEHGAGPELIAPWAILPLPPEGFGSFEGLIARQASINGNDLPENMEGFGGHLKVVIARSGSLSGTMRLGKQSLRFKSGLLVEPGGGGASAGFEIQPKPAGSPPLVFHLDFQWQGPDTQSFTGHVERGAEGAAIGGWQCPYGRGNHAPAAFTGAFNSALIPEPPEEDAALFPLGDGHAVLKVSSTGAARWSGRLPDGTPLSFSTGLGPDGEALLFAMTHKNRGSVTASAQIAADGDDLDGAMDWLKLPEPETSKGRLYRAGIPLHSLAITGGRYQLAKGQIILDLELPVAPDNAGLVFESGGLEEAVEQTFSVTAKNKVAMPKGAALNPRKVTLSLTASTGLFSGGFTLPASGGAPARKARYTGLLTPRLGQGAGNFLLPAAEADEKGVIPLLSGKVLLESR